MTRLTVTLQHEASYRVVPDGATLRVLLTPTAAAGTPLANPRGRRRPHRRASRRSRWRHRPRPPRRSDDVRFERSSSTLGLPGGQRAIASSSISGASRATRCRPSSSGRLRLELRATSLPPALARTLDVTAYRGVLKSITASEDPTSHATVIDIDGAPRDPGHGLGGGRGARLDVPRTEVDPAAGAHRARSHRRESRRPRRRRHSTGRHRRPRARARGPAAHRDVDPRRGPEGRDLGRRSGRIRVRRRRRCSRSNATTVVGSTSTSRTPTSTTCCGSSPTPVT